MAPQMRNSYEFRLVQVPSYFGRAVYFGYKELNNGAMEIYQENMTKQKNKSCTKNIKFEIFMFRRKYGGGRKQIREQIK